MPAPSHKIYSPFEDFYNVPVYSPAFSDPPSPVSSHSDGEDDSPKTVTVLSNTPPQVRVSKKRQRNEPHHFVNKKPRFPTIYHEALQPLAAMTTLPVACTRIPAPAPLPAKVDAGLQKQLLQLLRISDLSEIESFLGEHSENLDLNRCVNEWGESVLHEACVKGDLPLVKILVQFGADHRLTNRDGFSVVHLASFSGNPGLLAFVMGLSKTSSD